MSPIALSDEQLAMVVQLSRPLAPWQRKLFLEAVARRLIGIELGDGSVHAAAVAAVDEVIAATRYRNVG